MNSSRTAAALQVDTRLTRQLIASTSILVLSRGISFVILLVTSPLIVRTYGVAGLGLYATILSLNALVGALESGLGASVRTSAATHLRSEERAYVALAGDFLRSAFKWTGYAAALSAATLLLPWQRVLRTTSKEEVVTRYAIAGFLIIAILGCTFQVYSRVLEGARKSHVAAGTTIVAPVLVGFSTVLACTLKAPLELVVVLPAAAPAVQGLTSRLACALLDGRRSLPSQVRARIGIDGRIAVPMIIIGLSHALSYNLDYWLVSWRLGATDSGLYSSVARPAQLLLIVASSVSPVLWVHFVNDRATSRDGERVHDLLRLCGAFTIGAAIISLVFYATVPMISAALLANSASPPTALYLPFALWGFFLISHQPLAMFLNDAHNLRVQTISMFIMTAANVTLSLLLLPKIGVSGAVWASCIALACVHIPILGAAAWRTNNPPGPTTRSRGARV